MSVDSPLYTILTAGFGMVIVFFFLAFLSVLMVVINRLAGERTRPAAESPRAASVVAAAAPDWVMAGAVAFLLAEERDAAHPALPWIQRRGPRET